jgi:hypothetical protein
MQAPRYLQAHQPAQSCENGCQIRPKDPINMLNILTWAVLVVTAEQAAAQTSADAAIVRTRTELADAVALGVGHILIVEHINLSGAGPESCGTGCGDVKLRLSAGTKSVQVRAMLGLPSNTSHQQDAQLTKQPADACISFQLAQTRGHELQR